MKKFFAWVVIFAFVVSPVSVFAADKGLHLGGLDKDAKKAKIEAKKAAQEAAVAQKKAAKEAEKVKKEAERAQKKAAKETARAQKQAAKQFKK